MAPDTTLAVHDWAKSALAILNVPTPKNVELARSMIRLIMRAAQQSKSIRLSRRETQVNRLLASNLTVQEVGDRLGIAGSTVIVHRFNIQKKIRASRAAD